MVTLTNDEWESLRTIAHFILDDEPLDGDDPDSDIENCERKSMTIDDAFETAHDAVTAVRVIFDAHPEAW